jgi:triacylglycerol lipase
MVLAAAPRGDILPLAAWRSCYAASGQGDSMNIPRLSDPIVLVHGVCGYGRMHVGGSTLLCYWTNIPEALAAAGNRVLVPRLPPAAGIARRAAGLKAFLDSELPGRRVHLIAHSMGGLDSRYAISRLGLAERVLSLTTLGTPHRGTVFADWGVRHVEPMVRPVLETLGVCHEAFRDLTTDCCGRFNEQTPDAPTVRYFSVAAQFALDWTMLAWQLPFRIIEALEGPNDGLVSVASARWGEAFEVWEGDHASLVNRSFHLPAVRRRFPDRIPHYAALLQRLEGPAGCNTGA